MWLMKNALSTLIYFLTFIRLAIVLEFQFLFLIIFVENCVIHCKNLSIWLSLTEYLQFQHRNAFEFLVTLLCFNQYMDVHF